MPKSTLKKEKNTMKKNKKLTTKVNFIMQSYVFSITSTLTKQRN